jgi:glycosyltransferase involved in cell wall biosynthesis
MKSDFKCILLIAAFNESRNIGALIQRIDLDVDFVCIVDDASIDQTAEIATEALRQSGHNFIVLSHTSNTGQGGARATGALFAISGETSKKRAGEYSAGGKEWRPTDKDILIFTDGDGQLDPDEIPFFMKKFQNKKIDFVKGDRFSTPDLISIMPKSRLFGNVILSALTKLSSGYWDLNDSQCGYFAMRHSIASKLPWNKLRVGYGQINDIVIRLNELNARVSTLPIKAIYGVGEVSGIKIHKVVFPIFFTCLKGFYRRVLVKNTIWNTHPLAAFYLFGHFLLFLSGTLGFKIIFNLFQGETAPPLTSILVMVMSALGLLSIIQGNSLDLAENRRLFIEENDEIA